MFSESIPPIKPGDPITARWLNRLRKAALDMLGLKVEPPLELIRTAGGLMIRLVWRPRFWIRITGGKQPYAWQGLYEVAGGGWASDAATGTTSVDPSYEQNNNTAVPVGIVVLARRAWGTGAVVFQLSPCSTNQPSPGITPGFITAGTHATAPPPPPWMATPPPASFSGFVGGRPPLSTEVIPP